MIKIIIVILFIFNILACEPIQQASISKTIKQQSDFICLTSQSYCDKNGKFGQFTITFSGEMSQDKIKTELPFQIKLKFDAIDETYKLKKIASYLEGKTMFMGKIPIFFQTDHNEINSMIAQSLLANCSENVMTWRLWFQVEIIVDGKIQQENLFIDFDSERL